MELDRIVEEIEQLRQSEASASPQAGATLSPAPATPSPLPGAEDAQAGHPHPRACAPYGWLPAAARGLFFITAGSRSTAPPSAERRLGNSTDGGGARPLDPVEHELLRWTPHTTT